MYGIKIDSKIMRLKRPETKIGRNRSNHVVLAKSLKISRYHAVIKFIDDTPFIKDISEWGIFINNTGLLKNRWVELRIGDNIAFGAATVEEQGCLTEIVELQTEEQDFSEQNNATAQGPAYVTSTSNRPVETIDITLVDDVIHIDDDENEVQNENRSLPSPLPAVIPKTTNVKDDSSPILCISDEEEIIFSSPSKVCNTITDSQINNSIEVSVQKDVIAPALKVNESKPLDVTLTMNGLLKPETIESRPSLLLKTSAVLLSDEIENQVTSISRDDTSVSLSLIPNEDVKPVLPPAPVFKNELRYSNPDEIISLDSDEEDFPSSQLNTTIIGDIPDYSSAFNMMYELKSEVPSDDEDVTFFDNDSWYEQLSQKPDDAKSEFTKGWRKNEPVILDTDRSFEYTDVTLSDISDVSRDEIDNVEATSITSAKKSDSSTSNETPKPALHGLVIKPKCPKIAIIAPLPKRPPKRRSIESDDSHHKKRKEKPDSESAESIHQRITKAELLANLKSSSKKDRKSHYHSSSSSTKKKTREKVKALYPEPPAEIEKLPKEHKIQPKVKVTEKNRGVFLTELDPLPSASTSSISKPVGSVGKTKTDFQPVVPIKSMESEPEPSTTTKERIAVVNKEDPVNSSKTPKLPIPNSNITIGKPILKKLNEVKMMCKNDGRLVSKKTVKFRDIVVSRCKEIEVHNEVSEISSYKKFESLICKCSAESDQALATLLNWNVKWLQEQQKHAEPPPLYTAAYLNGGISDVVDKYKEDIKNMLYHLVWKSVFTHWNVPNHDNLPLTQVPGSGQVSDYYAIEIEKAEGPSKDSKIPFSTICAKREVLFFQQNDSTICNGKLVILNYRATKPPSNNEIKTVAFAYIFSYNRCKEGDRIFDRIILKVPTKSLHIVRGEAKMKILNYVRQFLKQFQALGMTKSSPIIDPICDVNFRDSLNSPNSTEIKSKQVNKSNRFLDSAQRKAVLTSLNCISKKSSVSLIDGPYGTGKTQVIVSLMHEVCNLNKPPKILIITVNDKLADDLVYRLCKDEQVKNVLRFGFCDGLNNSVKHCALNNKARELINKEAKNLISVEDEIKIARAKLQRFKLQAEGRSRSIKNEDNDVRIKQCQKEIDDLTLENSRMINQLQCQIAKDKVIEMADVVVTPYSTCWSSNFENYFVPNNVNKADFSQFKICIMDDANLLDESSMLIPQMLQVEHLILVGDKKVRSYPNSPYHKILHYFSSNNRDFISTLDEDHRMHPEVSTWVRDFFTLNSYLKIGLRKRKSTLKPFLVIDHISSEVVNYQAILCDKLAKCILEMDAEQSNLGVSVVVTTNKDKENLRMLFTASDICNKIRIDVFDGFSTRENDIIILCLPASRIFEQWLYIAMTRAKSTIIVCGDFAVIQPEAVITSLLNYAKDKKAYFSFRSQPDLIPLESMKNMLAL